ncbi:hypothetical protein QTP88_004207 [Uroleucon formosanum]
MEQKKKENYRQLAILFYFFLKRSPDLTRIHIMPIYAIWLCQMVLPRVMWTFCWHVPFGKFLPTSMPSRIRRVSVRIKESQMAK